MKITIDVMCNFTLNIYFNCVLYEYDENSTNKLHLEYFNVVAQLNFSAYFSVENLYSKVQSGSQFSIWKIGIR